MQPLPSESNCANSNPFEKLQLEEWNNTSQPYPMNLRVHQLASRQATAAPDAMALADGSQSMKYEELEQLSNRLAHHLREIGVGPDVLVGLCVDRSPMMVVGALAILKAGGAYLPIDPCYPTHRIELILADARPRVVITQSKYEPQLMGAGRELLMLDRLSSQIEEQSTNPVAAVGGPSDLAYVIYTSGSTGHPKGVELTHDGLLNLIFWHLRAFAVTRADRATQIASPGFDAAVWEIWPYLVAGASVHFVPESVRTSPEQLRDWLVRRQITISFLPTPLAERIVHLEWPATTSLRMLLTGADTLHRYPPASLPFVLVNNYGPTECTVVATSGIVESNKGTDGLPSIGRPIANTQVYVLGADMCPVPIGSSGELYIGGSGLARGYLNRPDLTAARFVPNPFSSVRGDRLYRTGDLARFLADGRVAFLGRVDDQVKVRGFRIELSEIVNALNQHPAIQESAVVARQDVDAETSLVAYVAATTPFPPPVRELREFLGKRLPDYMLPAKFISLDSLPIGPSGKVDHSALPLPSEENILRDQEFVVPRTPTEARIAAILTSLLKVEKVGVDDNFFLLGGNSLLGTQVIAHVESNFDVELTLLSLFDHPTVAGIAAEVEKLTVAKLGRSQMKREDSGLLHLHEGQNTL